MGPHVSIMKNNRPQISLRTLLAAMVGLLVAIALGFAVIEYRNSALARRNAELMAERNRLADTGLHAVDKFFFEDMCVAALESEKLKILSEFNFFCIS